MNKYMQTLAYLQTIVDIVFKCSNRVRRRFLLPIAKSGGRDMLLLKSGVWIDEDERIPLDFVHMRYDSEKHTVFARNSVSERNPWLSVITEDSKDISEFFCTLRVPAMTNEAKIMLFAHQKGWFPVGTLYIILRDGTDTSISVFSRHVMNPKSADVNYIR